MKHKLVLSIVGLALLACVALAAEPEKDAPPRRRAPSQGKNAKLALTIRKALRETIAAASAATVRVLADGKPVALGTVVAADGRIVTKASQLNGSLTCWLADGRKRDARLLGKDEATDLALLQIDARDLNLQPVVWRSGEVPSPGSIVVATSPGGDPLALGVISEKPQAIVGPGRGGRHQGWLGIGMGEKDKSLEVQSVTPDGAAAKAGVQAGDWIKKIDGVEMTSDQAVILTIRRHRPDQVVKLLVQRQDKQLELTATLGRAPQEVMAQDNWGGGPFSQRRWGFPTALPNDLVIDPADCGGPLVDTDGKVVGVNIARALRVASYALPAEVVSDVVQRLSKPPQP